MEVEGVEVEDPESAKHESGRLRELKLYIRSQTYLD
jgi:hypothetical protein